MDLTCVDCCLQCCCCCEGSCLCLAKSIAGALGAAVLAYLLLAWVIRRMAAFVRGDHLPVRPEVCFAAGLLTTKADKFRSTSGGWIEIVGDGESRLSITDSASTLSVSYGDICSPGYTSRSFPLNRREQRMLRGPIESLKADNAAEMRNKIFGGLSKIVAILVIFLATASLDAKPVPPQQPKAAKLIDGVYAIGGGQYSLSWFGPQALIDGNGWKGVGTIREGKLYVNWTRENEPFVGEYEMVSDFEAKGRWGPITGEGTLPNQEAFQWVKKLED